ncbi:ABC transporter ATP-binding protein [Devosia insulae]|nr:ABC transporter ATP-binding protein [Devosia insulae]
MISVENLVFTYPGASAPTLSSLTFRVEPGEIYGLLGPSGAGKSTTQRILMGLLKGFSGTAEIFGEPVASLGRHLYERIGVSFELPAVYLRLTALENLKLFAGLYSKATRDPMEVLASVDLADAAHQRVDQFSKGMKMRLNLCRALLHDPDLVFLDEPTTGQDPARSRLTRDLILALKDRGTTIFLTTHNMAEAEEICDRVGFLAGGCIPVTGSPTELMRQFGRSELEVTTAMTAGLEKRSFAMEGIGDNAEFLGLLTAGQVVSMHTQEASLDDIFIRATGVGQ